MLAELNVLKTEFKIGVTAPKKLYGHFGAKGVQDIFSGNYKTIYAALVRLVVYTNYRGTQEKK